MLQYRSFIEIVDGPGLRIVLVKGLPSPWGQAAKTIFEIKGLDYVAAPWMPGEPNADIVAWGGEASAPIVAWAREKPLNRWIDILYLAERLAPKPSLIPADAAQRALMIGLSHEICGEMGIGWNRRLQLFAPAYASGSPPAGIFSFRVLWEYTLSLSFGEPLHRLGIALSHSVSFCIPNCQSQLSIGVASSRGCLQ